MRKLTRRATVLTAGVVAATTVGLALAAWTSNGSGAGSAASTTSVDSDITAVTLDVADELFPGATKSTTVNITNPNDYPVIVTAISAGSSDLVNGCAADSVRTDARSAVAGLLQSDDTTLVIPANDNADYTLVLRMTDDPSDDCKSQTFNLDLTADLESAADSQSF
jgi:hypothetical protein